MHLGVVFPQTEIGRYPGGVRDYVEAAERAGYDYLLAFDHVLGADPDRPGGWTGPYNHRTMWHEPMVLFAFIALPPCRNARLHAVLRNGRCRSRRTCARRYRRARLRRDKHRWPRTSRMAR